MSVTTPEEKQLTYYQQFKKHRRKRVKRFGKNLTRRLAAFLGQQSLVEDKPVLNMADFPHLKIMEENWQIIQTELKEVLKHREEIPAFQEISPDQKRIATGDNWRTFVLFAFGDKYEKNCLQVPETTRLLEQVPNMQTACFSILAPNYHIPAHRGVTKGFVRCHLGLNIPKKQNKCRMRVENEICVWQQGKAFVFDDTYEHEIWNETNEERVILLFDFTRPMKFWGRTANKFFIALMRFTAYYQEPKKNMQTFEERFEAAARRNGANLEKLGR